MAEKTTPETPIDGMTFEAALRELEQVVTALEGGDVPLDRSIALYERGEALRGQCEKLLDAASLRVDQIVKGRQGREAETVPFGPEGEPGAAQKPRRGAAKDDDDAIPF